MVKPDQPACHVQGVEHHQRVIDSVDQKDGFAIAGKIGVGEQVCGSDGIHVSRESRRQVAGQTLGAASAGRTASLRMFDVMQTYASGLAGQRGFNQADTTG